MSDTPDTPALTPQRVAQLADELAVAAKNGLHWSKDRYDRERYERILAVASELLAGSLAVPAGDARRWYTDIPGHLTAKVGAAVAAFDAEGRILLIQRADNGRWALPGGIVEYGESPAVAVAREAWEESGVRVHVTALLGVYNTARHEFQTCQRWMHFVFLADSTEGKPGPSDETLDAGFFNRDEVAALTLSPGHTVTIAHAFAARDVPHVAPFFDRA